MCYSVYTRYGHPHSGVMVNPHTFLLVVLPSLLGTNYSFIKTLENILPSLNRYHIPDFEISCSFCLLRNDRTRPQQYFNLRNKVSVMCVSSRDAEHSKPLLSNIKWLKLLSVGEHWTTFNKLCSNISTWLYKFSTTIVVPLYSRGHVTVASIHSCRECLKGSI